jgi:hypothetical protein
MDKNNNKNANNINQQQEIEDENKVCFWVSVGLFAVGLILFVVSLFVTVIGFYGILASMIAQLAAITFLNVQKKHGYFFACKVIRVLSYIVMIAGFLVVCGNVVIKL